MSKLTRFSVSVPDNLLKQFDKQIDKDHYPTRSKAIADLISTSLINESWAGNAEVAGAVVLVYDHHKKDLSRKMAELQHDFHHVVISTQHVHLDHDNCLEIVVVKGRPSEVKELSSRLRTGKGIKHGSLVMTTTGKGI
jgi:CopG family transcriptional regulator, nickel-responsive regulator